MDRERGLVDVRPFDDLTVGERFPLPSRTVTEAHFAAFQAISGDNHPIHYDIEYCRSQGHSGMLAHGLQVLCYSAAGAGTFADVIGRAMVGYIDQSCRFLKPVYPGDTLYPTLHIAELQASADDRGGGARERDREPARRAGARGQAELPGAAGGRGLRLGQRFEVEDG